MRNTGLKEMLGQIGTRQNLSRHPQIQDRAGSEGHDHFRYGRVEAQRRELVEAARRFDADCLEEDRGQVADTAMRHLHTLGATGRARGVDDIGEVVGADIASGLGHGITGDAISVTVEANHVSLMRGQNRE